MRPIHPMIKWRIALTALVIHLLLRGAFALVTWWMCNLSSSPIMRDLLCEPTTRDRVHVAGPVFVIFLTTVLTLLEMRRSGVAVFVENLGVSRATVVSIAVVPPILIELVGALAGWT